MTSPEFGPAAYKVPRSLVTDFLTELDNLADTAARRAVVEEFLSDIKSTDLRDRVYLRIDHLQADLVKARSLAAAVATARARRRAFRRHMLGEALYTGPLRDAAVYWGVGLARRVRLRSAYLNGRGRAVEQAEALPSPTS